MIVTEEKIIKNNLTFKANHTNGGALQASVL
jgi:hypothetical protein